MATPIGKCPNCHAANSYKVAYCIECKSRLPWADIVEEADAAKARAAAAATLSAPVAAVHPTAPAPGQRPAAISSSIAPLRIVGLVLMGIGFIGIAYFFLVFDTSVVVPFFGGGRVNNLGLMQDRQNGLMMSGGAFALGAIIFAMDYLRPKN